MIYYRQIKKTNFSRVLFTWNKDILRSYVLLRYFRVAATCTRIIRITLFFKVFSQTPQGLPLANICRHRCPLISNNDDNDDDNDHNNNNNNNIKATFNFPNICRHRCPAAHFKQRRQRHLRRRRRRQFIVLVNFQPLKATQYK